MKYVAFALLLIVASVALAEMPTSQTTPAKKTATKPKPKPTPAKKTTTAKKTTKPKTTVAVRPKPQPSATPVPLSEKAQFEKASAHELASARVPALEQFLAAFPQSEHRLAAADLLASSRVLIADEKLLAGETADAVFIFKKVVEEAPQPIPNELFEESIAKIPSQLFRYGQRTAALELAVLIESKVEHNPLQLLPLADFYLSLENGSEAMRIAAKALAKDPSSAAIHRTLALTHRINFDLELSADSYAKALELEPDSLVSKRGLADMKRALGKSDEAVALYRELLAKNESDSPSRTGLVLALFDAGKRAEAETELANALTRSPGSVTLLGSAAYWYASRGIADKAVELGQKAIEREPRYIWSHIALARGLIAQGKPVAAEQVLVKARAYGNFPTLEYELASARAAAGFYREAAEGLSDQFSISPTGVQTRLGGRLEREEKSLADLVAQERRASIFAPKAADTPENAEILKALLTLEQKLESGDASEAELAAAADAFVKGSDKMKLHRQLYAASALLQKRVAIGKVLELAKAATGNTDTALEVADAGAAVMASELYEARAAAFRKNEFLLVPDAPRVALSSILRGRIEEITGWALFQQNNYSDATVRLRRAVSVMPAESAWWRSSMWRLGASLAAEGKDADALNAYIESYKIDKPDFAKSTVIEALYKKVNGSADGLEEKIGRDRMAAAQPILDAPPASAPASTQIVETPPANSSTEDPAKVVAPPITVPESQKPEPPKTEPVPTETPAPEPKNVEVKEPEPAKTPAATETKTVEVKLDKPEPEPAKTPETTEAKPVDVKLDKPEPNPVKPPPETTESKALDPPKNEPDAKAAETKQPVAANETKSAGAKLLFEPIIITIPNSRPAKPPATDTSKTSPEEKKPSTPADPASGVARPRVIDGPEVKLDEVQPCTIGVSQDSISIINNGGRVALLVNLDAPGDVKDLTAASSSDKDIEVTLQPEIAGFPDRRFYVIKSVSTALGVYQVVFAAPCGKKEVLVNVR